MKKWVATFTVFSLLFLSAHCMAQALVSGPAVRECPACHPASTHHSDSPKPCCVLMSTQYPSVTPGHYPPATPSLILAWAIPELHNYSSVGLAIARLRLRSPPQLIFNSLSRSPQTLRAPPFLTRF